MNSIHTEETQYIFLIIFSSFNQNNGFYYTTDKSDERHTFKTLWSFPSNHTPAITLSCDGVTVERCFTKSAAFLATPNAVVSKFTRCKKHSD